MNKGVRKVRRSIMKRKRLRGLDKKSGSVEKITDPFPQVEEKHGYFPLIQPRHPDSNHHKPFTALVMKGVLSVLLFFGVSFILKIDIDAVKTPKKWANYALTEEFPFARVHEWYQVTFGLPLAYTPEKSTLVNEEASLALPVIGNVTEPFQTNGTGIMIAPEKATPVSAWNAGVIVFAGNDRKTNKTVIVQHADSSKTVYGYLSSIDVHIYQFIGANEKIGSFNPTATNETIYFSLEKNNEYIDPAQVIKVDGL